MISMLGFLVMSIHSSRKALIITLIVKKTPTKITTEYLNDFDVLSLDLVIELLEYIQINNHAINLMEKKQLPYYLIYIFYSKKLEIFKTYIVTYLKIGFIFLFISLANIPIIFNQY